MGKEVTGFATLDEHTDYVDHKGRVRRLIYFAGIMVKKKYRGGRAAYLSFRIVLEVFKSLKWKIFLFGKVPVVFRTQDRRIVKLGERYGSAKSDPSNFTEEDWKAVRFVAEKYGWKLEEGKNICRGVYHTRLADKEEYLLPGLGEKDAKVCVCYISWRSLMMALWDVFVRRWIPFLRK
jgi:hypothetical protein